MWPFRGQCPVFGKKVTQKVLASARLCVTTHLLARGGGEGYVTFGNVYFTDLVNPSIDCFFVLRDRGFPQKSVCSLNRLFFRLLRGRGFLKSDAKSIGHRLKIAWRHKYWPGPLWVVSWTHNWTVNWPLILNTQWVMDTTLFRTQRIPGGSTYRITTFYSWDYIYYKQ